MTIFDREEALYWTRQLQPYGRRPKSPPCSPRARSHRSTLRRHTSTARCSSPASTPTSRWTKTAP
jgi:hypothetical protein